MKNKKHIMKKVLISLFISATTMSAVFAQIKPAIPYDAKLEKKVQKQLKNMTLEEKIGQMCEITIDVITDFSADSFKLCEAKLDTLVRVYKISSFLNVPGSIEQNTKTWAETIKAIQDKSMKEIGIPNIYGVDQIHGTTYTLGGTLFPQSNNMAATFNRDLVNQCAQITAYETKAGCIPWNYAPVMDLGRDPRWSRMWESFGEDCYVNAEMAVAQIKGFQGDDPNNLGPNNVAACVKHFMGYGVPEIGRAHV